nr:hypothetical protein [Xenophilus azovorans]
MNLHPIEYLDPVPRMGAGESVAAAATELQGKVVAFLDNGWSSFGKIGKRLGEVLVAQHGVREVRFYTIPAASPPPKGFLEGVAADCSAAVVGLAN